MSTGIGVTSVSETVGRLRESVDADSAVSDLGKRILLAAEAGDAALVGFVHRFPAPDLEALRANASARHRVAREIAQAGNVTVTAGYLLQREDSLYESFLSLMGVIEKHVSATESGMVTIVGVIPFLYIRHQAMCAVLLDELGTEERTPQH